LPAALRSDGGHAKRMWVGRGSVGGTYVVAAAAHGSSGSGVGGSTVQYSTVQYSTVQYSTVQYSTVGNSTLRFGMLYGSVRYIITWYGDIYIYLRLLDLKWTFKN
jgi:hypothetical protein